MTISSNPTMTSHQFNQLMIKTRGRGLMYFRAHINNLGKVTHQVAIIKNGLFSYDLHVHAYGKKTTTPFNSYDAAYNYYKSEFSCKVVYEETKFSWIKRLFKL